MCSKTNLHMKYLFAMCLLILLMGCAADGKLKSTSQPDMSNSGKVLVILKSADEAYSKEDWKQAESQYQLIIKQLPQDPYAWFKLGNIFARTDRPDEAIYAYRETLVRDTGNGKAYHNLALAYMLQAQRALEASLKNGKSKDLQSEQTQRILSQLAMLMDGGKIRTEIKSPAEPPVTNRAGPVNGILNDAAVARKVKTIGQAKEKIGSSEKQRKEAQVQIVASQVSDASRKHAGAIKAGQNNQVVIEVQGNSSRQANHEESGGSSQYRSATKVTDLATKRDAEINNNQPVLKLGTTSYTVLPSSLSLRELPDIESSAVRFLDKGAVVRDFNGESQPGWRRVQYKNKVGWVQGKYIAPVEHVELNGKSMQEEKWE